ncbi:MAG: transglycosylase SLT domain-containing protein [Epulopiscium sp.]|nr:transglycosylase SLT domain-containing protein [Candidatus Epulonipiscium sp.]
MTPQEFTYKYYIDALEAESKSGVPAEFILAEAAVLSNWGNKVYGNNFFSFPWDRRSATNRFLAKAYVYHKTDRYRNSYPVVIDVKLHGNSFQYFVKMWFNSYPSARESFIDFSLSILNRYPHLMINKTNATNFVYALYERRYWSNVNQRNRVLNTIKQIQSHLNLPYANKVKENHYQFLIGVLEISNLLKINPEWLMTVMWAESRLNPQARNPYTRATGLIQFMPATARGLKTTVDELYKMTNVKQLSFVYAYFKNYTGRMKSVYDLYRVTFFPISLGKPKSWVFQTKNLSAGLLARQNPAVDVNKDGKIDGYDFERYVASHIKKQTA